MSHILVIDDRPTNREYLTALLTGIGNTVTEAADGAEGLAQARLQRPDLVIADIIMPTMDGYEFVRQLRADPLIATTPVIFYTASYLEEAARELARACGVTHILVKPSDPGEILAVVGEVLGSRAAAPVPGPVVAESFGRAHLHLVTNKLAEKVDELERLNDSLEAQVARRTAELAAANEELRSLDRMKDEFLAIVSHDLRSPLSSIALVVEQMARRGDAMPVARRTELLALVGSAASRQIELVNDLLELASNASGRMRLGLEELRLSAVVRECVHAASVASSAKQLAVELRLDDGEPPIQADRLKLTRVVNNLLTNALKFTPAGGHIAISVAGAKDEVRLEITDSGTGIEAERLPHLFEKFKVDHRRGTADEEGSGLGLGIVRQLVELHGGRIEVASEVGRGSSFAVYFPRSSPGPAASALGGDRPATVTFR